MSRLRQIVLRVLLVGGFALSGVVLTTPQDAEACMHEMQRVSPKQNAVYFAEWRVERRHYRKAVKEMMKISPELVDLVEKTDLKVADTISQDAQLGILVLAKATIRSQGKWQLSTKAPRLGKAQAKKQLAWASKALGLLAQADGSDSLSLAQLELRFAQGERSASLLQGLEKLNDEGLIYESKPLETLAALQKKHKKATEASVTLALAKENKGYEMETPRPEYIVDAGLAGPAIRGVAIVPTIAEPVGLKGIGKLSEKGGGVVAVAAKPTPEPEVEAEIAMDSH